MFHNYEATVAPAGSAILPGMPGMLPGPPKALLFRHPPAPRNTSNHRSEGRAISYICFFFFRVKRHKLEKSRNIKLSELCDFPILRVLFLRKLIQNLMGNKYPHGLAMDLLTQI